MTEKYAVLQNGGKQYRVAEGQTLKVEMLDADVGQTIKLDPILLVANGADIKIGAPSVDNASVDAEIVSHGRHDKVGILKFKRRKHHMKKAGHRQYFTEVKILSINN